jgi:hypothetical protein
MKDTETKLFTPNPKKHLYTIEIKVMENCSSFMVSGDHAPTYHELIGVLEANKVNLLISQREINIKAHKKAKQ